MKNDPLYLNFYGVLVKIEGACEVVDLLRKDFEFFLNSPSNSRYDFVFSFFLTAPEYSRLQGFVASRQSINSITYDMGSTRYNDYYGSALSIYDYSQNTGIIYSSEISTLHELAYLLILSRTGKMLDTRSMHKVHAMGVKYKSTALILMMPMKGGKSTLFVDLLKQKDIEIISDDTPLVDIAGNCYSFPLRVGVHDTKRIPKGDEKLLYSLERPQYGKKILVPLEFFKNDIANESKKIILMDGHRKYGSECEIFPKSGVSAFRALVKHMIIGVGLPLIIEYFLEYNIKDFFRNFKILISRTIAAFNLARKAKFFEVHLGSDKDKNTKTVYEHLKKYDRDF